MKFASLIALIVILHLAEATHADEFTYVNEDGDTVIAEARLAGSGQGVHALELADGQILIVPQAAIQKRTIKDGPKPIDEDQMVTQLKKMFVEERLLVETARPFVMCLILAGPKSDDPKLRLKQAMLKKAGSFLRTVQNTFLKFIRTARVETKPLPYPLVVLIFEADQNFNQYAAIVTGNRGLSAQNIAGFYSGVSNQLVLRMSECDTFETPLHESIHMQVHNRGIFQRLAPVPTWLNEGMATGFEGDGSKVRNGPSTVSDVYSKLATRTRRLDWKEIVENDRAFRGDVFAGEAYGHAWGLHWLLVTKYRSEYGKYIRLMSNKAPLSIDKPDVRAKDFESVFGKPAELQTEFQAALTRALRRKRTRLDVPSLFGSGTELTEVEQFNRFRRQLELPKRLSSDDSSIFEVFAKPLLRKSGATELVVPERTRWFSRSVDLSRPIAERWLRAQSEE